MNKIIIIAALVLLAGGAYAVHRIYFEEKEVHCAGFNDGAVTINNTKISVAYARTEDQKAKGLMECLLVPVRSGMYFPFEPATTPSFWMRGMNVPIDIIWITDGRVTGILENVPISTLDDPPMYKPAQPVTGVLEIGAGQALALGITVGNEVIVEGL